MSVLVEYSIALPALIVIDGFQDGTSKGLTIPFIAENDDDDNCDE